MTFRVKTMLIAGALVLAAVLPAWAVDAAKPTVRAMPINKVWPRSAPNGRYLEPPALLRAAPNAAAVPAPYSNKINLNRASLEQLQSLPGVGPALGARLMAGRPYLTVGDLARIGLPFNTIEQIAPLVEFGP